METWKIVVIVAAILFILGLFFSQRKKDKPSRPLTAAQAAAQAEYEADMEQLELLKTQLAATPTSVLQAQIAALEAKLGLTSVQN